MGESLLGRLRNAASRHVRDPLYLNGYALVLNAGLGAALGFLFWVVAARRFEPEHLGVGAGIISAATLAALIGKAGFDAAIIRYAPSASPRGLRRLLAVSALATVALTTLVALVVLLLASEGVPSLEPLRETPWAVGFVLLAAATAAGWMFDAYFIAEQRSLLVLARNAAFNAVKLVVPLVIAVSLAARAVPLAWGVGLAASLALAALVTPALLRRRRPRAHEPLAKREVAAYAARNYAINLSEFLPGLLLPIIVLAALGPEANAGFYLAWTVATVAFLASKAIAQSAFSALVREDAPQAALRKGILLSALVLAPATLALLAGASLILGVFGHEYAGDSTTLLRVLALSIPAVAVTSLYLAYLKARDAGWELTLLPAAGLAALLALAWPALALAGVVGLGLAWLAVQLAMGAYAALRLIVILGSAPASGPWRNLHEALRTILGRRPHEG